MGNIVPFGKSRTHSHFQSTQDFSVADFCSHFFKEASSSSKKVQTELNKDSRLDINASIEERPPIDTVLEEIIRTRTRHNKHQNKQADAFKKKTSQDFSLLGLITDSETQEMSLKGKPISIVKS